ncbi:PDR/VanB family oxidoreductase [Microbacterium sp.]|uniref:PDR/VanB family oxidoreductase n=1 Tax=Microbacterium sp. TaxID=51671 RepID=UPI003A91A684
METVVQKHRVRVVAKTNITPHVVELRLVSATGEELGFTAPGAHTEIELANGVTRQYSLIPSPSHGEWRVAVLRENDGRGGSTFVHDELNVGDIVSVSEPREQFKLVPADRYLFMAGGIGITPFLSMIEAIEKRGAVWELIYTGHEAQAMAYAAELQRLYPERVRVHETSVAGRIDLARELSQHPDAQVYCCGPESLIAAIEAVGADSERAVHVERFHTDTAPREGDREFTVELAQTGITVPVPAGTSVLDVVEDAGAFVLFSCREGTCGTCEVPVLEGEIDHRDIVLTPEERAANSCMLVCVSRAAAGVGHIVLDL